MPAPRVPNPLLVHVEASSSSPIVDSFGESWAENAAAVCEAIQFHMEERIIGVEVFRGQGRPHVEILVRIGEPLEALRQHTLEICTGDGQLFEFRHMHPRNPAQLHFAVGGPVSLQDLMQPIEVFLQMEADARDRPPLDQAAARFIEDLEAYLSHRADDLEERLARVTGERDEARRMVETLQQQLDLARVGNKSNVPALRRGLLKAAALAAQTLLTVAVATPTTMAIESAVGPGVPTEEDVLVVSDNLVFACDDPPIRP